MAANDDVEVRRTAHGWFGRPWHSLICYDEDWRLVREMRKPFPAGESCLLCGEPFDEEAGDGGTAIPDVSSGGHPEIRHAHKECLFIQVVGPLAHHEGRCRCHGGTTETPGVSLREEALMVWRRFTATT